MPDTAYHDAHDARIIDSRLTLAVERVEITHEIETVGGVAQQTAVKRLIAEFGGFDDDDRLFEGAHKVVALRALQSEAFACTDPVTFVQRRAMLRYEASMAALVKAFPEFCTEMQHRTNRSMFELTNSLWKSDLNVRSICDVDGVSFQSVRASSGCDSRERDAAQHARALLMDDADKLERAAAKLRARASRLCAVSSTPIRVNAPSLGADDDFRILFHGQDLAHFPDTCIPTRPGRVLTLSVPARVLIGLSKVDPRSDYGASTKSAHTFQYKRVSPDTDHETLLFDVDIPDDSVGVLYLIDFNSYKTSLKFAGAHLFVIGSKRQSDICAWSERVLLKKRRLQAAVSAGPE